VYILYLYHHLEQNNHTNKVIASAATAALVAATSTTSKKPQFDIINASIYTQFKGVIAADLFSAQSHNDRTNNQQESSVFNGYHGNEHVVAQYVQFLEGKGPYGNLWEKEDTTSGPRYIIPQNIHRQVGKSIVRGGNMNRLILSNTYANQVGLITGRTLIRYAKDNIKEAKKIASLMPHAVKARIVFKDGDEYQYCSGKTEADLDKFLITYMHHWDTLFGATGKCDSNGE